MVAVPKRIALEACRGRAERLKASYTGPQVSEADRIAERICRECQVDPDDIGRIERAFAAKSSPGVEAMRAQFGGEDMRRWVRSELPLGPLDDLAARLNAIDDEAAAAITGILSAVFVAAVERTAVRVAKLIRKATRVECSTALGQIDATPQNVVRAAITELEEVDVLAVLADIPDLVGPILDEAAEEAEEALEEELEIEFDEEDEVMEDAARERALSMVETAMVALVLARLTRNEDEVSTGVPPNIARDTLSVAGGADSSDAGGVPSELGRVLVDGEAVDGAGLANSQRVVEIVSSSDEEATVEVQLVWRHSGANDFNPIHEDNDGKLLEDCDFRAGAPGVLRNCGCSWRRVLVIE